MPDFAWGDWAVGQVERVWDLMDITVLRSAKTGVDPSYKTLVSTVVLSTLDANMILPAAKFGICRRMWTAQSVQAGQEYALASRLP